MAYGVPVVRSSPSRSTADAADPPPGRRADVAALAVALGLIAAAAVAGYVLRAADIPIHAAVAPLFGAPGPQVSPATPAAVAVAGLAIAYGPVAADRARWRHLVVGGWLTSLAWVLVLALATGWQRFATRFERRAEYLSEVPSAPPLPELLATFSDRIVTGQPDSWTTHVAGHPPGALLYFVTLDRIGLGGGTWAAVVTVVIGSSATAAVAVAIRSLDAERMARRALPFLVLTPAAIWIGRSGDAVFLAVSAWAVALLAVAATQQRTARLMVAAAGSGLLFGAALYLSYGLVLIGAVALAALAVSRRLTPGLVAAAAALAVVAAVTSAGFSWWEGLDQLVIRYYQGWGSTRPYGYWVWANLAALAVCAGPATAPGIRRVGAATVRAIRRRTPPSAGTGTAALVLGALLAVAVADLSALSKGEVERIWLPFAAWLVAACALLPRRDHRWWLALQAVTALVVVHLMLPGY